jgi:hypothetical protein
MIQLRRPIDRRVLQLSLDDLAAQPFGILANCRAACEMVPMLPICVSLFPNAFVENNQPLVRHMFNAHSQLPLLDNWHQHRFIGAQPKPRNSASQTAPK